MKNWFSLKNYYAWIIPGLLAVIGLCFSCNFNLEEAAKNPVVENPPLVMASVNKRIDNPDIDLGQQLTEILKSSGGINIQLNVSLAPHTTYTWDVPVTVPPYNKLQISGEGFTNGAENIIVIINMTRKLTYQYTVTNNETGVITTTTFRCPGRLGVGRYAEFTLVGVEIHENIDDSYPLTPSNGAALFEIVGDYATLTLAQIRITATESVTNIYGWSYGRIKFGHTFVTKGGTKSDPVYLVRAYNGWNFAGHGGVISYSHTTLGAGVELIPADEKERLILLP